MTFRLRQIDFTADGRRIVRDRDLAETELGIGRAAENAIHLPDLAVEPRHARIVREPSGRLRIEALGGRGFALDGAMVLSGSVDPVTGAEITLGSWRLGIGRDADGAALITLQRVSEAGEDAPDPKRSFTLAGVMPSRRMVSWVLAGLILFALLLVPVFSHVTRGSDPKATIVGDAAWDPGALSLAHHGLRDRCQACHVKPFEPVGDATCKSCHKTVHDHAPPSRLAGARATPWFGERILWGVSEAFGKGGPGACVTCHREHEGAGRMPPPAQQFCADCHGSLKDRLRDTRLADASDFGKAHPEFMVTMMTDALAAHPQRVSLASRPREDNGLTFPHKLHLDPRGGVARMAINLGKPQGYGAPLTCANCHHATEDAVRFKPVEMERDCQACHSLAYDKVGATYRTLRHGDIDQMIADLSAADTGAEPIVTGRRRPGAYAAGQTYYANFALPQAGIGSIGRALGRDGVCGECHTARSSSGKPGVVPVTQISRFMAHGWFDHGAHREEKCSTCHAATQSTRSSDLLLPGIKQCRDCHLGEDAPRNKVASSCAMCHAYHPSPFAPIAARDLRRRLTREEGS